MDDLHLLALRAPDPHCSPGCPHSSIETCGGWRHALMSEAHASRGVVPMGKRTWKAAVKNQQGWYTDFHGWRKLNVLNDNGVPKRAPTVNWDLVTDRRNTVAGMLTWCLVSHLRDSSRRVSTGPTYFNCTFPEFKAIFCHDGINNKTPGIDIRESTNLNRITVTITCLRTLLQALNLEASDLECFGPEAHSTDRRQPQSVLAITQQRMPTDAAGLGDVIV